MEAYKIVTQFNEGLVQWLKNLPIKIGQKIEIIVLPSEPDKKQLEKDVLKSTVISYKEPFNPALDNENWEVLK